MLETWNFARSVPFISTFQKYLNIMLCQQIFCWRQHFLFKIFQNFIKIEPISNCYIQATDKGENDIEPSLESSNIGLHIYNNISYHLIKCFCWRQQFLKSKLQYFHDDVIPSRWHHGDVIWSKLLLKLFYYSRLNLLVKCNESWVTWINFTKKRIW